MILGTFNCELITPKDWGDCRLIDGSANCTVLKALKSWALKVVLQRSLTRNLLEIATSGFHRERPRSWPPPALVVSMPTMAGRNELKTVRGSANRLRPVPPAVGLLLMPTWVLESPLTPEWTLLPKLSGPIRTAPPEFAPPPWPNSWPLPVATFNGRPLEMFTIGAI